MRKDVNHLAQGVAHIKTTNTPWLIGKRIDDLETLGPSALVDFIHVINFN